MVAEEFQRYVAVYFGSRWGKSISDTNKTETINHHSCDTFTHGQKYDLDLRYGYASHFRTEVKGFLEMGNKFPFSNVFSDVEYFLLIIEMFGNRSI